MNSVGNKQSTKFKKEKRILYWVLAIVVLIVSLSLGITHLTKKNLVLENLADFDYTITQINQNDETKDYTVTIETETEEKEELVNLAYEATETIRDYENNEETRVVFSVYKNPAPGVGVEMEESSEETNKELTKEEINSAPTLVDVDLSDEDHQVTVEVTDVVKVYTLLDKSLLEKNINAASNWEIYNSQRLDGTHLIASVAMTDGTSEDEVYQQLKAIEFEMRRFNDLVDGSKTYFEYEREENKLWYGYSSVYPTSLIMIEKVEFKDKKESEMKNTSETKTSSDTTKTEKK